MKRKAVAFLAFLTACIASVRAIHVGDDTIPMEGLQDIATIRQMNLQPAEKAELIDLGEFTLTAYCPCEKCCGKWARNRPKDETGKPIVYGASGERLINGLSVAVDPRLIPYGTSILLDGQKAVAHDCGAAIKGKRIDVYFDSHEDALKFGLKRANVQIVRG